jgi:hypothetical protein
MQMRRYAGIMAGPLDIFDRLTVKTKRAKRHVIELSQAIDQFMATGPYVVDSKDNSQTGERTYYVHFVKKIPIEFSAILGDAIQNLRSALDHLAVHLVKIGPPGPRAKRVYFPIFETAAAYEAGKMGKIQGMGKAAIQAIDAVQPYPRGDGWALWHMHTMNNIDKHNLLLPIWGNLISHTFPKSERIKMESIFKAKWPDGLPRGMLTAAHGLRILEDGGELLTMPISELEDHMDFRISIALGEPVEVRGKEVISTIDNMHRIVLKTIADFSLNGLL